MKGTKCKTVKRQSPEESFSSVAVSAQALEESFSSVAVSAQALDSDTQSGMLEHEALQNACAVPSPATLTVSWSNSTLNVWSSRRNRAICCGRLEWSTGNGRR